MTWDNGELDTDFIDNVIDKDYGIALQDHRDTIVSALNLQKTLKQHKENCYIDGCICIYLDLESGKLDP